MVGEPVVDQSLPTESTRRSDPASSPALEERHTNKLDQTTSPKPNSYLSTLVFVLILNLSCLLTAKVRLTGEVAVILQGLGRGGEDVWSSELHHKQDVSHGDLVPLADHLLTNQLYVPNSLLCLSKTLCLLCTSVWTSFLLLVDDYRRRRGG